jgi:hypothetical protein
MLKDIEVNPQGFPQLEGVNVTRFAPGQKRTDPPRLEADAKHEGEQRSEKKSAATVLVHIAEELFDFATSESGETFGVPRSGPKVVQMLRGGKTSLRSQLSRKYFERTGKAAPQQAIADALLVVEGKAQQAEPKSLHLRVARHDGAIWIDLGDATGRAIRVDCDGWRVEPEAPVLFKRTALTGSLPEPQRGGALSQLWAWLNVAEEDRALVAAWLVAALSADIPHPILSLAGEQGSGKSTAEKVLVSLMDPSPVPLRKPPRDVESWVTAASGSWLVGIDNLSSVQDWLSDAMCRAVTGDGDVRRRLYTDGDMHVFAFRRCLVVNGIDIGAIRGDLADRLLSINLAVIPEEQRLTETGLWPRWSEVHPSILGAVLDLAARVASVLPSVELARKPRMADFAQIIAATDVVLGTSGLKRYLTKQGELAADSLTGDAFVQAIDMFGAFMGTSAELLAMVAKPEKLPRGWPADARTVTQLLRRQAPVMRKAGWHVEDDGGRNHKNVAVWTIRPRPEDGGIPSSQASQFSHEDRLREDARHARQESGQSQDGICAQCGGEVGELVRHDGALWHPECRQYWLKKQTQGASP